MSFYVAVHSDASRSTFKGNTAAHCTTRLNRHIILNSEYNVAVNSIMKYRRDGVDAALSRVSRDVKVETSTASPTGSTTPPDLTICNTIPKSFPAFPMTDKTKQLLSAAKLAYIKITEPIIFMNRLTDNKIELELVKNGTVMKEHTKKFRFTEAEYLTENMFTKITFECKFTFSKFTPNDTMITVSYANCKLSVKQGSTISSTVSTISSTVAPTTAKPTKSAITYGIRFWPQGDLKDYLFRETKIDDISIAETLDVKIASGFVDLRLKDVYQSVMECNIDALDKYSGNVPAVEVLEDVKLMLIQLKDKYNVKDIIGGFGITDQYFRNVFEKFKLKPCPKYQAGKNAMLWLSKEVRESFGLPEFIRTNDGRQLIIKIVDPALGKYATYTTDIQNVSDVVEYVNSQVNIQLPYILRFDVSNTQLTIRYSEHIKLTLPYVLTYYDTACTENLEQWPITIYYQPTKGMDKIKKYALVDRAKFLTLQGKAIKEACQTETDDSSLVFRLGDDPSSLEVDKKLEVVIPQQLAQHFKLPMSLKHAPTTEIATNIQIGKQPIWITCDLIDEMMLGEGAIKLLTPSPLDLNTDITSKQYVLVSRCRFSDITLSCYSDISRLTPYGGSEDFMVVLHFIPRYKRVRTFTDTDNIESYKKFCCNYG